MLLAIIMRGAAGSGKSTWVKNFPKKAFIVSTDKFFIGEDGVYRFDVEKLHYNHQRAFREFQEAIKHSVPIVILDNTNIKKKDYKDYVDYAQLAGYEVVQKVCSGDYISTHDVASEIVERMKNTFQEDTDLPHFGEIHNEYINEAKITVVVVLDRLPSLR